METEGSCQCQSVVTGLGSGKFMTLVATNVAAKGLDINDVQLIIQVVAEDLLNTSGLSAVEILSKALAKAAGYSEIKSRSLLTSIENCVTVLLEAGKPIYTPSGLLVPTDCSSCGYPMETICHALWLCPAICPLWKHTVVATFSSSDKALFWLKVDDETLLLNCDAAIDLASQRMGLRAII
ncbi:hypothetical protein G4B88_011605 [Cannabis sativa]|uniref:Uncharacterized protein n=1 Tax=Cannabis sativa TaxID=3483 RepID=A0A7J6GH57_CANSA|nr:hypothetical protein G4B88_011605 [Cannabis sativa]